MLKKFTLRESVDKDFVMSLFAPKVENLSWSCSVCFYPETVVIDASGMWRLDILKLETQESGFVLSLHVGRPVHFHSFDILLLFYVQSRGEARAKPRGCATLPQNSKISIF